MSPWQRVIRGLTIIAMTAVVGAGMVAMHLVPAVELAEVSGSVYPCKDLPGRAVAPQKPRHLSYLGEPHVAYNSSPPTSGPHMPWLITAGVYRRPIPQEYQVHLLEHGKVLVQYPIGDPAGARTDLERFARRRPDIVVAAPSSDVQRGVALTAWQRIHLMRAYDSRAIERFVSALARRYDHGRPRNVSDCAGTSSGDQRASDGRGLQ
jgi:hypothetical protein